MDAQLASSNGYTLSSANWGTNSGGDTASGRESFGHERQNCDFVCCDLGNAGFSSCAGRDADSHKSAGEPRHRDARSTGLEATEAV